jgi:hypothetical protein
VGLDVHGEPNPLLVRFLLDQAGHFIGFHLKALPHHVPGAGDRLNLQMLGQRLEALDKQASTVLARKGVGERSALGYNGAQLHVRRWDGV